MSKRPAFQFYPADWRKESGLLFCSMGARGLWIEMLCIMHEGEPYGHLTYRGKTLAPPSLARLLGENPTAVKRWYAELEEHEVFSLTGEGTPYSRRMVRDEEVRERRAAGGDAGKDHGHKGAEHGSKGGRPRSQTPLTDDAKGGNKPPSISEQKPPPSTASSSAPSSEGRPEHKPTLNQSIQTPKPSLAREEPPEDVTWTGELALNYVCQAAGWWPGDNQRGAAIGTINEWLQAGCSMKLILAGIGLALKRNQQPTKSLKRFDSTIRGMRRDQLGGELPPTAADVQAMTQGVAKRMSASG